MRGDARVRELRWEWICRSFNIEVHVKKYLRLGQQKFRIVEHNHSQFGFFGCSCLNSACGWTELVASMTTVYL